MWTPWGSSQSSVQFAPGIGSVSTAGHGGFYITAEKARERKISQACLDRSCCEGGKWWLEEDCAWAILAWELQDLFPIMKQHFCNKDIDLRKACLETLSRWYCDYLEAVGVEPLPEEKKYYDERKLDAKMRTEKHPDLIVCAYGDWKEGVPKGAVEVVTADGKVHWVTKASYDKRTGLNLLSKCAPALVESVTMPEPQAVPA